MIVVADGQGNWNHTYLGLAKGGYTVQAEGDGLGSPAYTFIVKPIEAKARRARRLATQAKGRPTR